MRKSMNITPTAKKSANEETPSGKTSGKKLVQARLPFKLISTVSSPSPSETAKTSTDSIDLVNASKETPIKRKEEIDSRKRKLSYDNAKQEQMEQQPDSVASRQSGSKENSTRTSKKRIYDIKSDDDLILIDDDKPDSLLEEQNNVETEVKQKTPKPPAAKKRRSAGTPQSAGRTQGRNKCTPPSTNKIQIKILPGGNKKNKRRKSINKSLTEIVNTDKDKEAHGESSDDIEIISDELNPQKRQKIEIAGLTETSKESDSKDIHQEGDDDLDKSSNSKLHFKKETKIKEVEETLKDHPNTRESKLKKNSKSSPKENITGGEDDLKTDSGTENQSLKHTSKTADSSQILSDQKKPLTPKQLKLMEHRRKLREEKERKLLDEKMQKQKEKEEKELLKKREREEKEELRRKEREEKDEQKRKDREEKERKRLAEIESKNEEKRKKNEAKEEEQRKKEDERKRKEFEKEEERKRKELEKEEAEMKKKKAAEAFTKFFLPRITSDRSSIDQEQQSGQNNTETLEILAFRPFQVKGDMKLAPICRKKLSKQAYYDLDSLLYSARTVNDKEVIEKRKPSSKIKLYLEELQSKTIAPFKWKRLSIEDSKEDDDDVLFLDDDLERVGLKLVEETHQPFERHRAKFYKFHENRRPPYYGTWRKKTNVIRPKKPFAQDKKFFDYEVDSDLEWEEEEPGESLDGSDDEKEKESEDEDYEVDNEWFVPHGHLSEEELQNEDENGTEEGNTREAQKAKLKILQQEFAQEMKKKTEKIKPRLVGCIWLDENGNQPELCPNLIWNTLNKSAMFGMMPPLVELPEMTEKTEPSSPTSNAGTGEKTTEKLKPITITEDMQKDLIRLIHGNSHAKVFLIKEFIAYVEATENSIKNGDMRGPLKSAVREKIEECAVWQAIESKNNGKNKKNKKRLCWIVSDEVLKKMNLEKLSLENTWQYTLQPKFNKSEKEANTESSITVIEKNVDDNNESKTENFVPETKKIMNIKKFTKVLTTEEKSQQLKTRKELKIKTTNDEKVCQVETKPAKTSPESNVKEKTVINSVPIIKKRVALLMSVPRGQQIPTTTKTALISQYLKKNTDSTKSVTSEKKTISVPTPTSDIIVLD